MKFIEIFEEQCNNEWEQDIVFEMANVFPKYHGINGVVIWVGKANKQHGLRVKVSNVQNKWSMDNHFVIQMPSLDYNPKNVAKWIPIKNILLWIKLNQELLYNYENGLIDDTSEFLEKISKL